jgi:hypothetical protein
MGSGMGTPVAGIEARHRFHLPAATCGDHVHASTTPSGIEPNALGHSGPLSPDHYCGLPSG